MKRQNEPIGLDRFSEQQPEVDELDQDRQNQLVSKPQSVSQAIFTEDGISFFNNTIFLIWTEKITLNLLAYWLILMISVSKCIAQTFYNNLYFFVGFGISVCMCVYISYRWQHI